MQEHQLTLSVVDMEYQSSSQNCLLVYLMMPW